MAITVPCTRCGLAEVPMPESIEIDPLCLACLEAISCPGYGDSCGNLIEDGDLCPDCTMARLDAQSPRIQR